MQLRLDSTDVLLAWTLDNRYVRELNCTERALYSLEPGCDAEGIYPTATPFEYVAQPPPTITPLPRTPSPGPTATITPTVQPRPILTAQVGEQRGEVAIGDVQIWSYEGQAGEQLTIRVEADSPANWATRGGDEPASPGALDTMVILTAPDGSDLNVYDQLTMLALDPPQSQDIEDGVNTDSLLEGFELPVDGTYTIEVSGYLYQTGGAYTLSIESQPPE